MSERGDKAKALFESGYNCAQATLIAFTDITGLSEETSAMIASGFGGGMGRMREVCGAVSGMFMAANMIFGYSDPKAFEEKKHNYAVIQHLAEEFKKENGSIICRESPKNVPRSITRSVPAESWSRRQLRYLKGMLYHYEKANYPNNFLINFYSLF